MNPLQSIDINCDLGENYGNQKCAHDHLIMPYISSCNIACGFHSGDPLTISKTILLAKEHGVAIGAHPSFPDLQGFGRRHMEMNYDEIKSMVTYQVSALKGMVEAEGLSLHHVKPHGALYNTCAKNELFASAVIDALVAIDQSLILYGLADSLVAQVAQSKSVPFYSEVFLDRAYEDNLHLRSRGHSDAVLNHDDAMEQLDLFTTKQSVKTISGQLKSITIDTLCIHSDTPGAVDMVKSIYDNLLKTNIEITSDRQGQI